MVVVLAATGHKTMDVSTVDVTYAGICLLAYPSAEGVADAMSIVIMFMNMCLLCAGRA